MRRSLLAIALLVISTSVLAQAFPSKTIRFIVPFPPGGGNDLIARIAGQKVSENIGQPVVIENRAGASGQIGAQLLAAATPDGYTIGTAGTHNTVRQAADKKTPYDMLRDFTPISLLVLQPNVLVVHPSVPARSLKDLIDLAKSQPGKLNYGVGSNGSAPHIASEVLKTMAGIDVVHVPYNGAAPALRAALANEVTFVFDQPATALPHIQAGKLRALGVTGRARAPQLPDVPTIAEGGLPGFEVNSWFGVIAPAGLPGPVAERLSAEFAKALQSPEVRDKLLQQGFSVVGSTVKAFSEHLRADIESWRAMIRQTGVSIE